MNTTFDIDCDVLCFACEDCELLEPMARITKFFSDNKEVDSKRTFYCKNLEICRNAVKIWEE